MHIGKAVEKNKQNPAAIKPSDIFNNTSGRNPESNITDKTAFKTEIDAARIQEIYTFSFFNISFIKIFRIIIKTEEKTEAIRNSKSEKIISPETLPKSPAIEPLIGAAAIKAGRKGNILLNVSPPENIKPIKNEKIM
jgi:hypothetical protein